jgi:hypothetical protein
MNAPSTNVKACNAQLAMRSCARVEYSADTVQRTRNWARDLQVGVLNAELERAWATINEAVARDEAHKRRVSK